MATKLEGGGGAALKKELVVASLTQNMLRSCDVKKVYFEEKKFDLWLL